jgi:hypothetical protein
MFLIQFLNQKTRAVGIVDASGENVYKIGNAEYLYDLALEAIDLNVKLEHLINKQITQEKFNYEELLKANKVLLPFDHVNAAQSYISGTGLTHINSAIMRTNINNDSQVSGDALKIYMAGLKNGKPPIGEKGSRPEWFFKGNGSCLKSTGQNLTIPVNAVSAGEEAELVALYITSLNDGTPFRVGFAIGNEFSDHLLEKDNHYYLAQSKLMPCSIGPEIFIGELPKKVMGKIKIIRGKEIFWQDEFNTGEEYMTHAINNIESYMFENEFFRQPGSIHYHFLGADKTSFAESIELIEDDIIEITASPFKKPLMNKIKKATYKTLSCITSL